MIATLYSMNSGCDWWKQVKVYNLKMSQCKLQSLGRGKLLKSVLWQQEKVEWKPGESIYFHCTKAQMCRENTKFSWRLSLFVHKNAGGRIKLGKVGRKLEDKEKVQGKGWVTYRLISTLLGPIPSCFFSSYLLLNSYFFPSCLFLFLFYVFFTPSLWPLLVHAEMLLCSLKSVKCTLSPPKCFLPFIYSEKKKKKGNGEKKKVRGK